MPVTDTRARIREIARARVANQLPLRPSDIRRELGRGSYSTICDELARFQKELASAAAANSAHASTESVSQLRAQSPVDWVAAARALGEQLDKANDERRQLQRQLHEAQQLLHERQVENTALTLRLQQLEREAAALASANAALREAHSRLSEEMSAREALVVEQFRGLQSRMMQLVDSAHQAVTARMRELQEQIDGVHLRESAFKQQISALREDNARLRGQIEALQAPPLPRVPPS
jgi:predicted  nucleic acid-binding Zn-ribbon protein